MGKWEEQREIWGWYDTQGPYITWRWSFSLYTNNMGTAVRFRVCVRERVVRSDVIYAVEWLWKWFYSSCAPCMYAMCANVLCSVVSYPPAIIIMTLFLSFHHKRDIGKNASSVSLPEIEDNYLSFYLFSPSANPPIRHMNEWEENRDELIRTMQCWKRMRCGWTGRTAVNTALPLGTLSSPSHLD